MVFPTCVSVSLTTHSFFTIHKFQVTVIYTYTHPSFIVLATVILNTLTLGLTTSEHALVPLLVYTLPTYLDCLSMYNDR